MASSVGQDQTSELLVVVAALATAVAAAAVAEALNFYHRLEED